MQGGPSFPRAEPRNKHHEHTLGRIFPADIRLVDWRDRGRKFSEIQSLFAKMFSVDSPPDKLQKRYRQIEQAIKQVEIEKSLWTEVLDSREEDLEELNIRIGGPSTLLPNGTVSENVEHELLDQNSQIKTKRGHAFDSSVRPTARRPSTDVETTNERVRHGAGDHDRSTVRLENGMEDTRPQTAGKTGKTLTPQVMA